jgi:peptide/nickel transport system substrate-binding protein
MFIRARHSFAHDPRSLLVTETTPGTQPPAPEYRKRKRSTTSVVVSIAIIAVVAIIAVIVFSLLNRGDATGGGNAPDEGEGDAGATQHELVVGLVLEPTNLDIRVTGGVALDQILIDNIYQGLIGLAPGSVDTFVPVLSEELPEISDDGLTYTFALREGVAFHSGNPLTAADVVDSLSATLTEGLLGSPATVSAPDERTIEIALGAPNSQLLWYLANRPGLVFETAYTGDLANTTNGTGPYTLADWKQGDSIAFEANADYWGDAPAVDQVVWRYLPDANAAVNAALEGDVDVLAPVMDPSLKDRFDDNADFVLEQAASTDVFTLGYNSAKPPLDDVRVRTALSKAIDSEAIIAAFYGDGKALGGPITDIEPAYEDLTSINSYDPDGARALLAEAGVEGLTLTVSFPNFYQTGAIDQVVTQFAEIGVTLEVDTVEFPTWLADVYSAPEDGSPRNFDLSYVNHAEANDFVNYVTEGYYFGAVNPDAKALYDQSIAATDPAQATDLLKQAARLVAEDAPAKWLINYTPTNAIGAHVRGFPSSNTNSRIPLAGITVD